MHIKLEKNYSRNKMINESKKITWPHIWSEGSIAQLLKIVEDKI